MKYTLTIAFLIFVRAAIAQSGQSGIYLTAADFQSSLLTNALDCKESHHAIKRNSFFNKGYITIIDHGQRKRYNKSEVFGYLDCDKNVYRFFDNKEYMILNTEGFCLYKHEQLENNVKSANTISLYFFSTSINSSPQLLTLLNLQKAFPDNHKFLDLLDAAFKSDDDLIRTDAFKKGYKLIHIYNDSQTKTQPE